MKKTNLIDSTEDQTMSMSKPVSKKQKNVSMQPITGVEFTQRMKSILPNGDAEIHTWVVWAKELEQMDSSNYELPQGAYKTQGVFLQELAGKIERTSEFYGKEVAGKLISIAQIPFCLFPWEIKQAAIHLADGANICEIQRFSEEGLLEDFSDTDEEAKCTSSADEIQDNE